MQKKLEGPNTHTGCQVVFQTSFFKIFSLKVQHMFNARMRIRRIQEMFSFSVHIIVSRIRCFLVPIMLLLALMESARLPLWTSLALTSPLQSFVLEHHFLEYPVVLTETEIRDFDLSLRSLSFLFFLCEGILRQT